MKRALIAGLSLVTLLTSCEQTAPSRQSAEPSRTIATVEVSNPSPPPMQILKIEAEVPDPPRLVSGSAEPFEQKQRKKSIPEPEIELESNYPKANPGRGGAVALHSSGYPINRPRVRSPRLPNRTSEPRLPYSQNVAVRVPVTHYPNTALPGAPYSRPPRHQSPAVPPGPNYPQASSYPLASSRPPASSYPIANNAVRQQQQKAWKEEERRLKERYLQSRVDALNQKYNQGRPHFNAHSPQVALSAAAPPSPYYQTRPRAPWDKLGHAFDRSEQARQDLRRHQQNRYSSLPPAPAYRAYPQPNIPSAGPFRPAP